MHRDEFYQKIEVHPSHLDDIEFPAIFLNKDGKIQILVNHKEINSCKTLAQLMNLASYHAETPELELATRARTHIKYSNI